MNDYILYTYQTVDGKLVCNAYGPGPEAAVEAAGSHLQTEAGAHGEPALQYMVLKLKPLPT